MRRLIGSRDVANLPEVLRFLVGPLCNMLLLRATIRAQSEAQLDELTTVWGNRRVRDVVSDRWGVDGVQAMAERVEPVVGYRGLSWAIVR